MLVLCVYALIGFVFPSYKRRLDIKVCHRFVEKILVNRVKLM